MLLRIIAPLLIAALGGLVFSGSALASCTVVTGTISITNCDTNERVDATATAGPAKLEVSGESLASTGTDDNGYITFSASTGPIDIELALTDGTNVQSDNYLGVDARTYAGGDIKVTTEDGVSIQAEQTGLFVKAMTVGDIEVINYAHIHAGIGTGDMGNDGLHAVSNGGTTTVSNYANVTSDTGRGIVADGGYVDGVEKVSLYNEGEISSFGDGLRVNAGGEFGADAEIINSGNVTGTDRRGMVAWSASGDVSIENSGEVTANGGSAIYGWADAGKVTITNDNKLSVEWATPDVPDPNEDGYNGIQVYAVGDVDVKNLDDGDIRAYQNGIYSESYNGEIIVGNEGLVSGGLRGIYVTGGESTVDITNSGAVTANAPCQCQGEAAIIVDGWDLSEVTITNEAGGLVAAYANLEGPVTLADIEASTAFYADQVANYNAVSVKIGLSTVGNNHIAVSNAGTMIGRVVIASDRGSDQDYSFDNSGLWVMSGQSGFEAMSRRITGTVTNTGTIVALGDSRINYSGLTNGGEVRMMALEDQAARLSVEDDYVAQTGARVVFDWAADSVVDALSPVLEIQGSVTGTTQVALGRVDGLDAIDWTVRQSIPVIQVWGDVAEGGDAFAMTGGMGFVNYKLEYVDGAFEEASHTWVLAFDPTSSALDIATAIPFAARNLFKDGTQTAGDRLDEIRNAFASTNGGDGGPLGYAPSPNDPVSAALAIAMPSGPTTGAWVKTNSRYGQGDGYDLLTGTIEAGIDATVDTGKGRLTGGAFAGTGIAQLDFDLADTEATLSGPLLGGYANYSSDRAYFGVIAAVQTLGVDASFQGASASFSGITYGGRIDAGYRFGDELIIEPAVALAASHTEFDTFEMNAVDVGFIDADSLAAEARLRIARDFAFDGMTVTPFAVATLGNEFLGTDGIDADVLGSATGAHDGLYGDLSAGVTVTNADGTISGFAKGNVGYAAGELWAGVRLGANAAF